MGMEMMAQLLCAFAQRAGLRTSRSLCHSIPSGSLKMHTIVRSGGILGLSSRRHCTPRLDGLFDGDDLP